MEVAERNVLHLDLDTFFVSVERLRNSELEGKPLIIGGREGRGVVASCSYEARRFGVHSAMPTRMALQLCPQALVISGDMEAYTHYSQLVTDVISEQAPLFEKSSIDEFYLDLSGMDRFVGCYRWASELRERVIRESGLPLSFGLSLNKTVSKVATGEAKPNGRRRVPHGQEHQFLDPLSIRKIPMIGDKTYRLLRMRGIERVGTLRQMPVRYLHQMLGKNGDAIWKKANGIDHAPVEPYVEAKSISTEQTFEQDTIDVVRLRQILVAMTEKLGHKLRRAGKLTACVTVKIRYANFDTETRQVRIPYTACDETLVNYVLELFEKLYQRRMLLRLVGVKLSHLVRGHYQISLFDDTPEEIGLYQALDRIKQKHGVYSVIRASGLGLVDRHNRRALNLHALRGDKNLRHVP